MEQELILKTDVASKAASMGKNQPIERPSEQDIPKAKPFSSTLNEQIDKHAIQTDDVEQTTEVDESELAEVQNEMDEKAEAIIDEDGNSLPIDVDAATIELAEQVENTALVNDGSTKELVTVTHILIDSSANLKPQQSSTDDVVLKDINAKLKQQPILRSDILNALPNKQDSESVKNEATVLTTVKIQANELLGKSEIKSSEQVTANLLNQQKIELPQSNTLSERNVNNLVSALTTTGGTSTANTVMQSATVGQPVLAMQPSMQSEAWGRVLSSRVVWMAREGVQQAVLRMNPANLGPVEVKLHMNNEQATVSFVAQHAATRDALEQALPKLRESFQENGMDLAHADVSDHAAEQHDDNAKESSPLLSNNEQDLSEEQGHQTVIESNELEQGVSVFA